MIGLSVKGDASKAIAFMEGIKLSKPELRLMVLRCAVVATGHIRKTIKKNVEKSKGKLARSFRETFLGHSGNVTSAASHSKLIYARIQDEGGVIRAKGKKLAVPLRFANVPAGKSPRHWPDGALHLIPRPGKPPLLVKFKTKGPGFTKDKETGKRVRKEGPSQVVAIEPKYVLVSKVTLKPKRYIDQSANAAGPDIEKTSIQFYKDVVDGSIAAARNAKKRSAKK